MDTRRVVSSSVGPQTVSTVRKEYIPLLSVFDKSSMHVYVCDYSVHTIFIILSLSITECNNYTMAETSLNLATEVRSYKSCIRYVIRSVCLYCVLCQVLYSVIFVVLGEDDQVIGGESKE